MYHKSFLRYTIIRFPGIFDGTTPVNKVWYLYFQVHQFHLVIFLLEDSWLELENLVLDIFLAHTPADCVLPIHSLCPVWRSISLPPTHTRTSLRCHSFPTTQSESTWNGSVFFFPRYLYFELFPFHVTCFRCQSCSVIIGPNPNLVTSASI